MNTRVALIEDDPELRAMVAEWLQTAEGMEFAGAHESAEAAYRRLTEQRPDVVLVDINLPQDDGIACVRKLKRQMPSVQFLMVTVYNDTPRIFRALAAGATGYLLKRASRVELLTAIKEIREGGAPMSMEIARQVVQSFQAPASVEAEESAALTPREHEILEMLAQGFLYKEIAEKFGSSWHTINTHVRRVYEKLHVRSRSQAVAKYFRR